MSVAAEPTAASKLNTPLAVPATPPMLICAYVSSSSGAAADTHVTLVADDHDEDTHAAATIAPVAVWSVWPKSSPATVTDA